MHRLQQAYAIRFKCMYRCRRKVFMLMSICIVGRNLMNHHCLIRNSFTVIKEEDMEDIADADCKHAKREWKDFKTKNLGEYHDWYVQSNTLSLEDAFESFCS